MELGLGMGNEFDFFDDCFVFFMCVCAGAPTLSTAVSATSVWLTLTTTASGSTPASDQETIGRKKLYHRIYSNSLSFKMPKIHRAYFTIFLSTS